MNTIKIKRIYETYENADGYRILVDRLWPRGVTKEAARLDEWAKEVTPSSAIRTALHTDLLDWSAFEGAYRAELEANDLFAPCKLKVLGLLETQPVTFLTAAKLEPENHAAILKKNVEK